MAAPRVGRRTRYGRAVSDPASSASAWRPGRARAPRVAPPGDQRPQRLPGRRRRHGRQHGAHAARRPRRARPARAEAGDRSIDEIGRDEIVESVARAALLGARGNSGVILSQLIRGAAEELVSRPGELVDPVLLGAAFANAADRAYASVREPAEGTILTVMRDMATSIAPDLAHLPERAPGPDADRRGAGRG